MVGIAALASIGAVIILWLALGGGEEAAPRKVDPADVLNALDSGRVEEAKRLATALEGEDKIPPELWGLIAYAKGVAAFDAAEASLSHGKKDRYRLAARHLEEARDRGFPPNHERRGLLHLGKSLYCSEQFLASQPVLREALKANPGRKVEILWLLAGAYLNAPNPLLKQALKHNDLVLAEPKLSPQMRQAALLQRAQIQLRQGEWEKANETLAEFPAESNKTADVQLLRAWALKEQAQALQANEGSQAGQALEKYREAIKALRQLIKKDSLPSESRSEAMYLIGACLEGMGDTRGALDQFYRTYCDYTDSPEALAASFHSAELNRKAGQKSEAMAGYRHVLMAIKDVDTYNSPWIPLNVLRERILDVYRYYFNREDYGDALQLAGMAIPLFPEARAIALKAEAYQAWGRKQLRDAEKLPPTQAQAVRRRGRRHLRLAGQAYLRLAQLHYLTRDYTDDLWMSAENLLDGHDYQTAAGTLREYLKNETRRRYPLALVRLGEAMLAQGRIDDALEALTECINYYPRDAASFRARLLAGQTFLEKEDHRAAKAMLEENLTGGILAPSSEEWRDSLFTLGRILRDEKQYAEAISRLEEAVTRYPDCEQALEGRYLAAECYRLSARQMREQIEKDMAESVRQAHEKQVVQLFDSALKQYEQLESQLKRLQRTRELDAQEKAILRNCVYAIGAVLFDLQRYDAAVKAYSVACNRYQNSPEVLEAYLQLARAYRRLGKPNEARSALDQAKVALARMKADERFTETTNHSKQGWSELLDWMGSSITVQKKQGS